MSNNYYYEVTLINNKGEERSYCHDVDNRWENYEGFISKTYYRVSNPEKIEIDILMPVTDNISIIKEEKEFLKSLTRIKKTAMICNSITCEKALLDEAVYKVIKSLNVEIALGYEGLDKYSYAFSRGRFLVIKEDK